MTVVVGLVGIGLALLLSRLDIHSLLDLTIELAGLLGGGFAGAYTLGMFTRRANSAGVSIGVATAIVVTMVAWWNEPGASVLLSRHLDRHVHRRGLPREPVLPGADRARLRA